MKFNKIRVEETRRFLFRIRNIAINEERRAPLKEGDGKKPEMDKALALINVGKMRLIVI